MNSGSELGERGEPEATRFWATIEYDGTDFYGFQIQARAGGERTVQGEVERALEAITGVKTRVAGAGRTDRGVHAQGQVISFEARWRRGLVDLQRALNAVLASDVAVLELGVAPEGFHPRFSALKRAYRYTILNQPWPAPLSRRTAWHVIQRLDIVRMAEASQCVVGRHDFASFGQPPRGENTVRTVYCAEWHAASCLGAQGRGSRLVFDIEADAFLNCMVRRIVGLLVLVGRGQVALPEFKDILEARDMSLVKQIAPANGLCLVRVDYAAAIRAREGV